MGVIPAERSADLLRDICRETGSISSLEDAVSSTLLWVRRVLGDRCSNVSVLLPDRTGRLRVVGEFSRDAPEVRSRSARCRQAHVTRRAIRVELRTPPGQALYVRPLLNRGGSVGVLEIVVEGAMLDARIRDLDAAADQAAMVLRNARERERAQQALGDLGSAVELAVDVVRTERPSRAIRSAVDLCHEHLLVPVVGWIPVDARGQQVMAARGLGRPRRAEVARTLADLGTVPSAQLLDVLPAALEPTVGSRPLVFRGGDAFLIAMGGLGEVGVAFAQTVAALLDGSLRAIETVAEARARSEGLDVGIAWTAHELRGPLLGARTAIDHLIASEGQGPRSDLLCRTRDELGELARVVDPLLRWSAGGGLSKRPADLVELVRQAVRSCALDAERNRVDISAPSALEIRADPKQLRIAIANLIRNALHFSPDDARVAVEVGRSHGMAWVWVIDRGPGVPAEEGQLIFDLFARGSAGAHARDGAGVGLFITRRVVEAHGGRVRLLPSEVGASFCIELPLAEERRTASAS